jgi:hypothetical protein
LRVQPDDGIVERHEAPFARGVGGAHLGRIAELLAAIDVPGAFATSRTTSAAGLRLAVKEVGQLTWPLRRPDAQRLIAIARPARYGLRDQTRLDARVRDTWEIPKNRVAIAEKSWRRIIDPVLTRVRHDLGLPEGLGLRAALHNLLVYQPGQFFRSHQDSEKTDDMMARSSSFCRRSSRAARWWWNTVVRSACSAERPAS